MTRPEHFAVSYAINPWMNPASATDAALAVRQWDDLRQTYLRLGHQVEVVEPVPGLPDMVYAANGALITARHTIGARFSYPQRAAEAEAYAQWLEAPRTRPRAPTATRQRGRGRFPGRRRPDPGRHRFSHLPAAHREVAEITGMPVVSLELVDPRFYHLDTALAVLDDETVAYYPGAFSVTGQATLAALFPDAVIASEADAAVLGLNAVSDGRNVVLTAAAVDLAQSLAARGFRRFRSTSPNCSRAAAASSAARSRSEGWRCPRDRRTPERCLR